MDSMLKCKILVIIPAHNEEALIKNTIRAIKNTEYPNDRISIVVIADRCSDNTAEIAKDENIEVYDEIRNDYCTKGGVLQSFFEDYPEKINQYDYVCIVDADTFVDRYFFIEADRLFKNGCKIVQSKIKSRRKTRGIVEGFMTAVQSIQNVLFYKTLKKYNRSVLLAGKGMLFTPDVFNRVKWDGSSFIEDVDISFQSILAGIPIVYSERALVSCFHPSDLNAMWGQQRRWKSGQYLLIKKFFSRLVKGQLRDGAMLFTIEGILSMAIIPIIIIIVANFSFNIYVVLTLYCLLILLVDLILTIDNCGCNQINIRDIFCFPLILLLWYFISFSSFIYPAKKW